jgi:hypothetical protein
MLTSYDTETILFGILKNATSLTGNIFTGDDTRPTNDNNEAITINTIDLICDSLPQTGTSNVNVYVPDTKKKIDGVDTFSANRKRLRVLAKEVLDVLRGAVIQGITITPGNSVELNEPNIRQHYYNIRVEWNICV